jgi:hypothetical protein
VPCLGHQTLHDLPSWDDVVHQPSALACEGQQFMYTPLLHGGQHLSPQAVCLTSGVIVPALPGVDEWGTQGADGGAIPLASRARTDIVPDLHYDRILRFGFDNPVLPREGNRGFHGGQEPGPDIDPDRAQDQDRRQSPPIRNPPRRDDWHGTHGVHDLREEGERRNRAPVTARFAALGDDDVDAALSRLAGLRHGMDLLHHQTAHRMHPLDQVPGIRHRRRQLRRGEGSYARLNDGKLDAQQGT